MGDVPYAEMTYRGKIGPATLSKPEPGWGTTIPQDLEHETSAGRQVPSPKKQMLEDMLRSEGLRYQAKHHGSRDEVVRNGAVRDTRRKFGPGLAINRAGGIPSWGTSNVRFASKGTTVKEASFDDRLRSVFAKLAQIPGAPVPPPMPPPGPVPPIQPSPLAQPGARMAHLRMLAGMRHLGRIEGANPDEIIRRAERANIPVSGWTKVLNHPAANLMIQMGAISAVEPILSTLGVQHPLFYMMAPWAMMSFLPDYLKKLSKIEGVKQALTSRARSRILGSHTPRPVPTPRPVLDPTAVKAGWEKFMGGLKPRIGPMPPRM